MIEFIKDNIGWIKDLGTLVLAVTATIISILTYRRARATLLQPIRNEVIKKQSEILSNLLSFIRENESSIFRGLDYDNIARTNALIALEEHGFKFHKQESIKEEIAALTSHYIIKPKGNRLDEFEVLSPISEKKEDIDLSKERFELAKQGKASIVKLTITKKHDIFHKELIHASENAFLPEVIQKELRQLLRDIHINLAENMITTLEDFINEYTAATRDGNYPNVQPSGVFNKFNRVAINHDQQFNRLKSTIREYLRIDEEW